MKREILYTTSKPMSESDQSNGQWKCVDDRPFGCPNGCGLLSIESATSVYCKECGYVRTVIDYVEDDEPTIYIHGKEAVIRGVEREWDEDHPQGFEMSIHYEFIDSPREYTHEAHISQVRIEGGLAALNDHLLERGLVPQWWVDGKQEAPEQLDE